jgi:poly(hydroxyalkanoate) depolymerase family esterase
MYLYVPPRVLPHPEVLLALHWCQGTGPQFHEATDYARLADDLGFIVIFPSATRAGHCWDVHSTAALTHGGGSDPQGLLSMIGYVIEHYHANREMVFVTGHSSGGMMTQVLLGAYPDVFRAGASSAGVPFGCFAGTAERSEECANGKMAKSPEEWAGLVRSAWPGFNGPRPRLQLWHGTADDMLAFHNFGESIKQWTRVLETGDAPVSIDHDTPSRNWERQRFASAAGEVRLEAFSGAGMPHNFRTPEREVIRFFGLTAAREGGEAGQ